MQLSDDTPREMSVEEIKDLIEKFGRAAQRARQCGFDAVELHGAHGYMPLQFLSGYTNKRTDAYGGSLENRARFALETIRSIKRHAREVKKHVKVPVIADPDYANKLKAGKPETIRRCLRCNECLGEVMSFHEPFH